MPSKSDSAFTHPVPPGIDDPLVLDHVRSDPLKFLVENTAKYGDIFSYKIDQWSAVVVNHPTYVSHVLHASSKVYTKIGTPDLMMLRPMLGEGLMTSEGSAWLQQRRTAQPSFHHRRIEGFAQDIVQASLDMLQTWATSADTGVPIDVAHDLSHLTLRIVAQCLFGTDIADESADFAAAVGIMNEYMGHFDPNNRDQQRQFGQAILTLKTIVQRIIIKRRIINDGADDLLSSLMAAQDPTASAEMNNRQLCDQIFTFLMAGHETTAKALTWTLYLLDQHPAIYNLIRQEIQSVLGERSPSQQDVSQLTYTWMVIREAMRLYPPVWSVSRMCAENDEMGGYTIPAGTLIVTSPYTLHRHPAYWEKPLVFDPERFSPSKIAAQVPFTYVPFSTGSRICIGQPFATLEMVLVLATTLQKFHLRLMPDQVVVPEALVTLRPKGGLLMLVESIPYTESAAGFTDE